MGVSIEMVGCAVQALCRRSWGNRVPSHVHTQAVAQTLAEGLIKKLSTVLRAEREIRKAKIVKARSQN